jgi:hypothetical protein
MLISILGNKTPITTKRLSEAKEEKGCLKDARNIIG